MSYKSFLCNIDNVIEGVAFEHQIWILRGASSPIFPKHDFQIISFYVENLSELVSNLPSKSV